MYDLYTHINGSFLNFCDQLGNTVVFGGLFWCILASYCLPPLPTVSLSWNCFHHDSYSPVCDWQHMGIFLQDKLVDPWINPSLKKETENQDRHQSGNSKTSNWWNLIYHKWMLLYFNHTEERMIYRHSCFWLRLINETCTWTETEMETVCSQKHDRSQLW